VVIPGSALAALSLVAAFAPGANAVPTHHITMQPQPDLVVPGKISVGPLSSVKSNNWAGYVDRAHIYDLARATWRQPKVRCGSGDSIAAFWVGLDGYTSPTVEQDGTLAYCHHGRPTYYTWWEMYPRNDVQLMHASVKPGDKVTSSVVRHGTRYTLKVVDHTHPGNSFQRFTNCAVCKNSSAEWIAERVTGAHGLTPLSHFSHMSFFAAKEGVGTARGSISKYLHDSLTMVDGKGATMASPTELKKDGRLFGVTWHRSQ
jgi:hypothetical protein